MRLAVTKKYVQEQIDKYQEENEIMTGAYGMQLSFFSLMPKSFIVLSSENRLILIKLGVMSGEPTDILILKPNDIEKINYSGGIIRYGFKIFPKGGKKINLKIQKVVLPLGEFQKDTTNMIRNFMTKVN